MRNITVSVDDETYRRARIRAAEADTTVAALVRGFLEELVYGETREERFERLKRLQDDVIAQVQARGGGLRAEDMLSRDELHDRDALR